MNDTGGGVTAIHDVPGDITRIGFHWMLFFPFCHSKGASICSSHGVSRNNLFYHELSNYRISFTRNVAEGHGFFLITRLVLGPTDQREVIFEFSNFFFTRSVSEITDFLCPETCPWTH